MSARWPSRHGSRLRGGSARMRCRCQTSPCWGIPGGGNGSLQPPSQDRQWLAPGGRTMLGLDPATPPVEAHRRRTGGCPHLRITPLGGSRTSRVSGSRSHARPRHAGRTIMPGTHGAWSRRPAMSNSPSPAAPAAPPCAATATQVTGSRPRPAWRAVTPARHGCCRRPGPSPRSRQRSSPAASMRSGRSASNCAGPAPGFVPAATVTRLIRPPPPPGRRCPDPAARDRACSAGRHRRVAAGPGGGRRWGLRGSN
jgi:hypothetical protein